MLFKDIMRYSFSQITKETAKNKNESDCFWELENAERFKAEKGFCFLMSYRTT